MGIPTGDFVLNQIFSDSDVLNFTFANSAAANAIQETANVALPTDGSCTKDGMLYVANPSQQSDLTCRVYLKHTLNGVATWGLLAAFNVPKGPDNYSPNQANKPSVVAIPITGLFVGEEIALVLSLNSALDASGGFTGHAAIRKM